ncbi:putative O-antigen ligase (RfaL-like) [Bradyrhizobium sp. STM 3843]|uniref:O-antigen ligase family protein n=1 Tax=Bradyrhizobium sp. STM 3843 TaxID=551947 RepID=UPI00024036B1|nr:O-antigen ligase family protein [Bradyrhizobium sp. STM 3843]CCE08980.1 putative O-antigen ligase (RfaL-like) [Bradyrhizobium sp. STM 3843]
MTALTGESPVVLPLRRWRDPAAWRTTVDVVAILLAAALPWSTSLVSILGVVLLITMLPHLDLKAFLRMLRRPISIAPIALFALALLGTLWSDAAWGARLYAVGPAAKLLVLPPLFYHFERSQRGVWVFVAFLGSCVLMVVASTAVAFDPALALKPNADHGIFVKNYIDQSQEFSLCAVALAYPMARFAGERRWPLALLMLVLMLAFLANMVFVVTSRTALVTIPIMLAVFGLIHLKWRANLLILLVALALGATAWTVSPQLRQKVATFTDQYQAYKEDRAVTSIGERLEFWRKSLHFLAEAPLIGHGTGATRHLFELAASGRSDLSSGQVVGNPHNQTLYVAVQWGALGIIILYAMWLSHLLLFRGDGLVPWIGLLVVVQNIFTSLFNSHIFDFHEGWMYVMGVGVAGGMVLKARLQGASFPESTAS